VPHPTQADTRNRLLAALSPEDFAILAPHLEPVELPHRQVLVKPGEPIRHAHFPEAGVASFLALLVDGGAIEVGLIGRDGLVGVPVVLGVDVTDQECVVQLPGHGWRLESGALRAAIDRSPSLRDALLRYAMAFLAQVAQTAARIGWRSASRAGC
jgi:CRP-like cAMP-binding protein